MLTSTNTQIYILNVSMRMHEYMHTPTHTCTHTTSLVENAKLKDLHRELKGVVNWFQLGLELDIPDGELLIIRKDNVLFGVEQCLLEVLIHWGDREKPTWTKVVGALVKIGRHVLAENIAKKYGKYTYTIIIIYYYYKECGLLRSPIHYLRKVLIYVSTAWKVTACMVHQSHSIA